MKLKINRLIYMFIFVCIFTLKFTIVSAEENIEINKVVEESVEEESILEIEAKEELGDDINKSNANLKLMRVDYEGIVPNFENNVYEYYLTVPNDIEDLEVVANSENPNANVEIKGNKDLKEGLNIIEINVISEDKTKTEKYKIEVTKSSNLEFANTNLQTLAIENVLLNPVFDNNVVHYTAEVSYLVKDLRTLVIPENENAIVEVSGTNNLKAGKNQVLITVIAQNGYTKKEIVIDIYKKEEPIEVIKEKNFESQEELTGRNKKEYETKKTIGSSEEHFEVEKIDNVEENSQIGNSNNEFLIAILELIILISLLILIVYTRNKK